MLGKKQNVFDDFIAAAEWLIDEKVHQPRPAGDPGRLQRRPARRRRADAAARAVPAVVCQVPLLDMVRYHKFLIARLWIPEYGSADDPKQFKWLHAYSPYHRVKDGTAYPAVLLATAESDTPRRSAARPQDGGAAAGGDGVRRSRSCCAWRQGRPRRGQAARKVLDELTDIWSFLFWQTGDQGVGLQVFTPWELRRSAPLAMLDRSAGCMPRAEDASQWE